MSSTDKIEKTITLRAPVSRVWRALTDANEFGRWFGVALAGPFVVGKTIRGTFDWKFDEPAFAAIVKAHGVAPHKIRIPDQELVFCTVEKIEPEHTFVFRWIPYGIDAAIAPDDEPTTLVEFHLEPVAEGTRLRIVESGFDRVPAHRRERAFRMNAGGWAGQAENLRKYVET
jgi:uncharacterized protein YndB with AHSA1/START domain